MFFTQTRFFIPEMLLIGLSDPYHVATFSPSWRDICSKDKDSLSNECLPSKQSGWVHMCSYVWWESTFVFSRSKLNCVCGFGSYAMHMVIGSRALVEFECCLSVTRLLADCRRACLIPNCLLADCLPLVCLPTVHVACLSACLLACLLSAASYC